MESKGSAGGGGGAGTSAAFRSGTRWISVSLPSGIDGAVVEPPRSVPAPNPIAEIQRAVTHPVGSDVLPAVVRRRRSAAIAVNDGTRPTPTASLLEAILPGLLAGGIAGDRVIGIVATGTHPPATNREIADLLGQGAAQDLRVVSHNCRDEDCLKEIGYTSDGMPVIVNRRFLDAGVKILTGSIVPHQSAGFSGGRKSVMPGLAGLESIRIHHSALYRAEYPVMGWFDGNPFHAAALEAARIAEVDFILNTVQDGAGRLVGAFAGDLDEAWRAGVAACRAVFELSVPSEFDIVVVGTGGHPRDADLYQAQKAIAAAEMLVKKGGVIVLVAECRKGVGPSGFVEAIVAAENADQMMSSFRAEGYVGLGSSKAFLLGRGLRRASLVIASPWLELRADHLGICVVRTPEEALRIAVARSPSHPEIALVPNGVDLIPRVKNAKQTSYTDSAEQTRDM
jgi:nickel-dependent lactate racemase